MLRVEEASKSKLSVDLQILRKRFARKETQLRDAEAGFEARLAAAVVDERERAELGAGIAEAAALQAARGGGGGGSNAGSRAGSRAGSPRGAAGAGGTAGPAKLERQQSLPGRGMGGFLRGGGTGQPSAGANTLRGGGGSGSAS
jgi:hypothetical protein